jgi:hypothetical protein
VTTEAEATRLLKRADPARDEDSTPFVDAAGYLATLRTRSSTVTLIDTETTRPGPPTGHRWPIIAAAAAVVAIVVSVLWLIARDDDPSNQVPAGTTVPASTAVKADVPLAEGIYRTPELTREQVFASGVAAGFDRADIEAFIAPTGSFETVRYELWLEHGSWKQLERTDGWKGGLGWRGTYEVVDNDTVVTDDGCGTTYDYTFDGEQLTLDMVDDQCGGGLDELMAVTTIYETAPFTFVSALPDGPATTATSVAGEGN